MQTLLLKSILEIIILVTAIPVGYLLAWLCKDEIVYKKWMLVILYCFIIVLIIFVLFYRNLEIILGLIYMIIIALVSIFKSKDKVFLKS